MKKLTRNQQLYQKEIKRIRRNLSKLRSEGYDVSELAQKYNTKLPSRVTTKLLKELHNITPKKLKNELKDKYVAYTPRPRTPLATKPEAYETVYAPSTFPKLPVKSDYQYIPPVPTGFMDLPSVLPDEETFEETPDNIETEPEEVQTEEREIEFIFDEEKGIGYTVDKETGEIIDEEELNAIIDDEGFQHYFGMETGMYYGQGQNVFIPDMDSVAFDTFYTTIGGFPFPYRDVLKRALDKMIEEKGMQAVAEAFMKSTNGRPNVLEKLMTYGERYNEALAICEDIADILDIPMNLKSEIKDYVYRESMADIETYGT